MISKKRLPGIAQVNHGGKTHFVVVESITNRRVNVLDPQFGKLSLKIEEFINYEEALKYHQQGLQIRLDNDLEQTDIAASYTWIGNDYLALNDMEKSKQNLEIALSIREKILGTDHPDYAWTLDSLFCWYKTIKDYKSALQTINRIIEIRMACLGKEHSYTILAIEKRNSLIHNMT